MAEADPADRPCPDTIVLRALMRASVAGGPARPQEQARALLFAWIMSLPAGSDIAGSATRLRRSLAALPAPGNPLLPDLVGLLKEIGSCAAMPRRPGGRRSARRPATVH